MDKVVFILGTRPEVIKCAPVISALKSSEAFLPIVISTGQHRELSRLAFETCGIQPDVDLDLMEDNQSPAHVLGQALVKLEPVLQSIKPSGCLVQGDTATTLAGALSAFHQRIPVAHIEAGLRTYDFRNPFPEETYRSTVSRIASLHFCPTETAAENLRRESITENIFVVGNTVVDAALFMKEQVEKGLVEINPVLKNIVSGARQLILVTGHRRENYDEPLHNLCLAIRSLVDREPDVQVVFPVHLNPNIQAPVYAELNNHPRIHLIPPVDYPSAIYLIKNASLIITDSGGIQEEAPSFGTPVMVTRFATERPEGIDVGTSILTPLDDVENLIAVAQNILGQIGTRPFIANPFGCGNAALQIVEIIERVWTGADSLSQAANLTLQMRRKRSNT